jgi:hypothetical protein
LQSKTLKLIVIAVLCISVLIVAVVLVVFVLPGGNCGPASIIKGPTIYDHTCTDVSQIPGEWIDAVQTTAKLHFCHRSHGEQLEVGVERIESANATFSVAIDFYVLPTEVGAFCIMDGQPGYNGNDNESYIYPDLYWQTEDGLNRTRDVLNNVAVNFSMWTWCDELEYYDASQVQAYLDNMSMLETEYPNVTFIYMTSNAQTRGESGYNRYLRNQEIRQYCKDNNKILYDFADIDCWYNGVQSTYCYNNISVPVQHPHFNGDQAAHTTYESCEYKGAALWWMMACLAGWAGP